MTDRIEHRRQLQAERHDDLVARVRRLLAPLRGDERALDVGCGAGALAYALAPLVGEVVGIDASEELVNVAREHAPAGCTFVVGDAEALPFPYGDFDLVGCLRVLHHVRRPELVVAEIARVTRPGGSVVQSRRLSMRSTSSLSSPNRTTLLASPSNGKNPPVWSHSSLPLT